MLALEIQFLTGRYAATAFNDRGSAEWPPHPARVMSALVESLHAADDAVDPVEARALDLLAGQPAPQVRCSPGEDRRVMTVFVPVNDQSVTASARVDKNAAKVRAAEDALAEAPADLPAKGRRRLESALQKAQKGLQSALAAAAGPETKLTDKKQETAAKVLPWRRTKQGRTFPVVIPHVPRVVLAWPDCQPSADEAAALSRVAQRVARLGHSSSFVSVRSSTDDPQTPELQQCWVADPRGDLQLRVPRPSQRALLEQAHARHGGDVAGRVMPALHQRYSLRSASGEEPLAAPLAGGGWFAYRLVGGTQPPAGAAVAVAHAVRGALLAHADPTAGAMLLGHDESGPARSEHLAVLPLPYVGFPHSDGAIKAIAFALPAAATLDDEAALLRTLGAWEATGEGRAPGKPPRLSVDYRGHTLTLQRVLDPLAGLRTLRRSRWAGVPAPARRWATVTPIALDGECPPFNHSVASIRRKAQRVATKLVRRAITRLLGDGLQPDDIAVSLVFDAPVPGAAHLRRTVPYGRRGHARPRRHVHAVFTLPRAVRGPLVVGAGRHFGLGLCVPLSEAGGVEGGVDESA